MLKRFIYCSIVATITVATASAATPIPGSFALQNGTPQTAAYLSATEIGSDALDRRLDAWLTSLGSQSTILAYRLDMTKYLHMVIVSDDFASFMHVHPTLGADGHFRLDQPFPRPALYHIYVDGEPQNVGQQVFRFDVDLGSGNTNASRDLNEVATTEQAGPYTVRISTSVLSTRSENHLEVHIFRNGSPATDLHPYLGALAHAVFIDAEDLSYVHTHPMPIGARDEGTSTTPGMKMAQPTQMPSMPDSVTSAPDMMLHVAVHEVGTYKLWLQFRGGRKLYVAPFVLTAR